MEKHSTSEPSPLSPTLWPPEAFAWQRSLPALLIVLAAFGVGIVLTSVVAVSMGVRTQAPLTLSWGLIIGELASYAVIAPTLLAILPRLGRRSLRDLGLRAPDARAIVAGILGAIAMYAVTLALANLQFAFTHAKPSEVAISLFTSAHDRRLSIAFGVLAVAIAPVVEELVFRGFLFNSVLRYAPVWVAAAVSGIVFGFSHGSLSAFLPLAGSGVVLAYVYYKTGSLAASMLTHGLFNGINVALLAIGVSA